MLIFLLCEDTVNDAAALDVSALGEVKLDEFSKPARVVVVNGFGISERFHNGTAEEKTPRFCFLHVAPTAKARKSVFCVTCSAQWPAPPGCFSQTGMSPLSSGSSPTGTEVTAWCSPSSPLLIPRCSGQTPENSTIQLDTWWPLVAFPYLCTHSILGFDGFREIALAPVLFQSGIWESRDAIMLNEMSDLGHRELVCLCIGLIFLLMERLDFNFWSKMNNYIGLCSLTYV